MSGEKRLILLGTHDVYIHSVVFDAAARTLTPVGRTEMSRDPSWLTRHPTLRDIVYANGHVEGKVFCLRVGQDGALEVLDEAVSGGGGPTHLAVLWDHSALLIAHYGKDTGSLASLPLDPATGRFLQPRTIPQHAFFPPYTPSPHPRLDAPHVHQVVVHGDELVACDLGNNKVWRLRLGGEADESRWVVKGVIEDFEAGDGPRHAVVHPSGRYVYVLNEVSSFLTVHTLPPSGPSRLLHRYPIRPEHDRSNDTMLGAEILLLPPETPASASLLVLSNRFSTSPRGDALALFTVSPDGSDVKPARVPHVWGVGRHIRALDADPSGRYVLAAGRDAGGVVVLERTGDELREVARADIPNVVVPLWM